MAEVNFNELFGNFTAADAYAATKTEKTGASGRADLYKPSINDEKCVDQTYRALIRFIPFFYEGKRHTIISRWECYLKDVNGDNGIFVVSPKTVNKSCPMRNLSYKLFKSDSAVDKANSKKINVYQQYYALVEIVNDKQHPEYNGKVMIYQFGQKIKEKIENAMKDTDYTKGFNPFDFFNGRLFELNMTKDASKKIEGSNKSVANYDACNFILESAPIHFTVNDEKMTLTNDKESQKAFLSWLDNGAPKITDYFWKEWDAETTAKVNANLATYTSGYEAPRTTAASAREAVNEATEPAGSSRPQTTLEDMPDFGAENAETTTSEINQETDAGMVDSENEEWIRNILNG